MPKIVLNEEEIARKVISQMVFMKELPEPQLLKAKGQKYIWQFTVKAVNGVAIPSLEISIEDSKGYQAGDWMGD